MSDILEELIKIHDKYRFEIKFTYPFDMDSALTAYHVDTYLFIPGNLGVNSHTYSHEDFYSDMQTYIRLKTPNMLLKNITNGENNPFSALVTTVENLVSEPDNPQFKVEYEYKIKMFCSIFRSALRDEELFIEGLENSKDLDFSISNYLSNTWEISKKFRGLRKLIHVPTIDSRHFTVYQFADEYISLVLDRYRYKLLFFLDGSSLKNKEKYRAETIKRLTNEIDYRKKSGYPSVPDPESDNEVMVYRASALKKLMGSILFLNTRKDREGKYLEQIIFCLGAALAMAFATSVAFFSKTIFGDLTLSVFVVMVIAYVFKDRIKELSRNYLTGKIRHFLFDHRTRIYSNMNQGIGYCKEGFSYVSEYELPEEIDKLRNRDYLTELDNGIVGEKVILYKKYIKLLSDRGKDIFKDVDINGINDISRFNIRKFLDKMDNPEKHLYFPLKNEVKQIKGSRVYHLNMILKYSMAGKPNTFHRFRIILQQDGIKRIEEVKT